MWPGRRRPPICSSSARSGGSAQNVLTSPSASGTAGQLAVGLFGLPTMRQTFAAGSAWTMAATAAGCTRALAEFQPVSKTGSMAANAAVSGPTYYYGGLLVFSDPAAGAAPLLGLPPLNTSPPTAGKWDCPGRRHADG